MRKQGIQVIFLTGTFLNEKCMNTKTFSPLHIDSMTANNVYSLSKSTIDLAIPLKGYLDDSINSVLTQLTTSTQKMQQELSKSSKSDFTEKLLDTNKVREDRFTEIKRVISSQVKGRDERKKSTAQSLDFFFTPYWFPVNKTMDTQTGVFFDMFNRYHLNQTLSAAAKIVGVDLLLTELETINSTYDALYKLRIVQEAILNDETFKEQKSELCNSYSRFCDVLEQAVNFKSNDILLMLFNGMDELRQKYYGLLPKSFGKYKVLTVVK